MADLKLPSLTTPSFSVPNLTTGRIKTPKLTTIGPVTSKYKRAQKQTRHVTDLGDLFLGNPITGTRQLQETLKDNDLGELVYVPILNRIVGAGLMVQERIVSPVLRGDVDDAFINILESFSGTLDTLANPIKSLLPFAGGGTAEDFLKSMGWLDGAYREQYQWDTGNTVLDLLGEMVSDPANWFTFGGAGAAKQASKGISKEITSELTERYGREVIDDINLARVLSKLSPEKLFETTADLTTDNSKLVKLISDNITEQREYYLKELVKLKKGTKAYNKTASLLKQYNTLYANIDDVSTVIAKARNSKWYAVYKQAIKYEKIGDTLDKELFKAAAMLTGTYVPATILVKQITPKFKAIYNKATQALAKVTPTELTGNPAKVHKQIMREVRANNEAMYSYHFDTFKNRIKYFLGSDKAANDLITNLRKICHDVIEDNKFDVTNRAAINNEFIRRAVKYEPRLKTVFNKKLATRYDKFLAEWSYNPNALDRQAFISELAKETNAFVGVMDELDVVSSQVVDAIVDESYMEKMLTLTEIQKFKDEIDNRMRQLFKKPIRNIETMYLKYLNVFDSITLPKLGKLINVPDLNLNMFADNYLEILTKLSKADHNLFLGLVHFKDYLGINKSNIKQIANIITALRSLQDNPLKLPRKTVLRNYQNLSDALFDIIRLSAKDDTYVNVNAAIKKLNSSKTKTGKNFIERIEKEYIPEATLSEQELKIFEDAARETYKTVEVYKEDLTKSLEDLLNDYSKSDLDVLYEGIDDVFDYAGTDEYSFTIKEYLNTLLDPSTDYITYRYTLDELKSLMNKLNVNIKKYSKPNIPSTIVEEYDGLEFVNNVKEQLYKMYPTKEARKKVGLTINVLPKDSNLIAPVTGRYPYKIKDSIVRVTRNNFYNPGVALDFLTDLRNILNSEPVTMYIGDFDKILKSETKQKIYVEVMSKMDRTRYIENSILTDVDHEFLVKLMDHNSDYRKSINEVINKFIEIGNNTGDEAALSYARSIKMTLLKLESMTMMHDCLNMPYIDAMDISFKELKNLAHGYTFSALTSPTYAGKRIDAVTETDIKNILKDIKANLSKSYRNSHYKELGLPEKSIDDFVELKELEDKIRHSELYDLTDDEYDRYYAKYEELKEALSIEDLEKFNQLNNLVDVDWRQTGANIIDNMMVEIENNIRRYATALRNFADTNNLPQVKLFNVFEKTPKYSDITNLNLLGENYDNIMEILTNSGTAPKVIEDTTDYILNTAGARIKTDVEKAHRSLINRLVKEGNTPYSKIPQDYIDRQIGELTSIADAISRGYRDIGKLNEQKRGNAGLLGKLYHQKNGTLKIHNITKYVAEDAIRNVITENTALSNIFEMSNAYNNIAWKRIPLYQNTSVFDNFFSEDLLSYRSPKAENAFKLGFSEIIEDVNPNMYSKDYINIIRQTLIDYYNTVATDVVPKNVGAYFNKLNKRELIAWHRYTSSLYITKTGKYRTMLNDNYAIIKTAIKDEYDDTTTKVLQGKIAKANELNKVRTRYEQLLSTAELDEEAKNFDIAVKEISDKIQPEEESFERIVANSPAHRYPRIINELSNSVDKPFKSLDEVYAASHTLSELAKQDSTATSRLKVISDIANDERIFKDVYPELFEEYKDVLRSYNINATTKMNDRKLQRLAKHSLEHNLYESVLAFNPTELRAFIDHNTDGIMLMHDPSRTFLSNYTEEELTKAGIRYMEHSTSPGFYLVCRTDQTMHDATLSFKTYAEDSLIGVLTKPIRDMHKANQYYYHLDGMYFDMDLFTGDMLKREVYNDILNVKEFSKFIGDEGIQKSYRKINNSKENLFHIKNVDRPNLTIIGYEDPVNNFISQFSRHLSNKTNTYGYLPTRFDSAALSGSTQAITRWNTEHKYAQIFFTNDFSLDAPMFKQVLDNATDEELKQFFARNKYSACVLVRNSHNRPVVRKIFIENKAQLKAAREMGAVCLPHELYRNATLTINKHKITSKFVNACRLLLESTFKTIYLTNPGFLMRNFFDSAIYKNLAATDGMSSFVDNFKYYYRAQKMLEEYDSIIRAATVDGVFNQRSINKVFKELSPDKQQMYLLMDMYMNTGASGGLTESLEDFFIRYNKKHGEIAPTYNWAAWYRDNILNNGYTRFIQNINNKIEQTSRLALFLNLLDNGDEFTSAITKVINTHFDYSLKMQGLEWLENVFWFSTFPINNVMFYLNEGLTKNPELLKLQLDLAELSWNDQENYTWDDVRRSNYLTYNALTGNVRIKVQGKNIVIKTGSSVFDFMNVLLNPVGEAADRLNPFIAVPLGLKEPEQLNPLNSVVSKINQIKNNQSYLPSVYTTLYPKYEYRNKHYQKRYYSSWSPKVRRPYIRKASSVSKQMAYRAYKFYTRRFYTRKTYNPLNRRIRYLAVFDEKRGRYARAAAKYSRQMKQVHRR